MNKMIVFLDEYAMIVSILNKLPLVLTNEDLKREFQISDSTLNRIIKLTDFPSCWYGIHPNITRSLFQRPSC